MTAHAWEVSLMSTWTSAGGVPLAHLGPALPGSEVRRELGGRGQVSLDLDALIAWPKVRGREVLRIDRRLQGDYVEFRAQRRRRRFGTGASATMTVVGVPRIYDLADADVIRETIGGRTITRFSEALTFAQYLTRFFFTRAVEDGLVGIGAGLMESTEVIPLTWDRWTKGQLLDALLTASQRELQWRIDSAGLEWLDVVQMVGGAATTAWLHRTDRLRDFDLADDVQQIGTVARVAGDAPTSESERATIGENVWRVASRRDVGGGLVAVDLRSIDMNESPLIESGQYVADVALMLPTRYLERADGIACVAILATDVATHEFTVTASEAPQLGERVRLVADSAGTPLEVLELPSAIRAYGRVVRDVVIPGGRGERQLAENGGHEDGLTAWSAVHGGDGVEIKRSEFGVTVLGAADGARAASTAPATPFPVRGFPVPTTLRRHDELRVGGALIPIASAAIPDTLGALTLALSSGLPGNYPHDTAMTLERRELRTWALDGDHSAFAATLLMQDSDTDHLMEGVGGTMDAAIGGYHMDIGTLRYESTAVRAGRIVLTPPTGYVQALDLSASGITFYNAAFAGLGDGIGTASTVMLVQNLIGGSLVAGATRLRWIRVDGEQQIVRVTAVSGADVTVVSESHPTIGFPGSSYYYIGTGLWTFNACNAVLPHGTSFDVLLVRESRVLRTNGAHSVAAMSVLFQAQAAIARRTWLSSDQITLDREITATLVVTNFVSAAPFEDEFGTPILGTQLLVDIDTGASTMDAWTLGVDWLYGEVVFTLDGVSWQLTGISGSQASFQSLTVWYADVVVTPQTASATWIHSDTYALSGTAHFGTNGRVVLTLASVVPAGRSYARGAPLWANWHTRASYGRHTLLRLHDVVNAGDGTMEIGGQDSYLATSNPASTLPVTCYRVAPTASRIPLPGNTLYVAASVACDNTGAANVQVTAANANTIPDGAIITVVRPAMIPAAKRQTGSAQRLVCGVGGTGNPVSGTPGRTHDLRYVRVPAGATRTIAARAWFSLTAGTWTPATGPCVALVDAQDTILAYQRLADGNTVIEATPGEIVLTAQTSVAVSGLYGFRVFGGAADLTRWCVHLETLFYPGDAADAPYTGDAWATRLMIAGLRGLPALAQPRYTDAMTLADWTAAHLPATGIEPVGVPPIVLGGRVYEESTDRLARVSAVIETPADVIARIEVGQLAPDGTRQIAASTAALTGSRR